MWNLKKIIMAVAAFTLIGCAPVISKDTLKAVDRDIKFEQVVKNPDAYAGKGVVFGGTILDIENREDVTILEVLQEGVNSQLKPVAPEESEGRFLVRFKGFKDPAVYSKGKHITVAGKIVDAEERKLGKGTYLYPVIEPAEHYLWKRHEYDRGPSLGIGLGLGYTHID
ncbi:MAG: Slp family lipoprotein [Deltaproteobacteria bacterium]|nr:Slp family lipoprotein [Deltaproteobacteria bacterium]